MREHVDGELEGEGEREEKLQSSEGGASAVALQLSLDDVDEEAGEDEHRDKGLGRDVMVEPVETVFESTEAARPCFFEHHGSLGQLAEMMHPLVASLFRFRSQIIRAAAVISIFYCPNLNDMQWLI